MEFRKVFDTIDAYGWNTKQTKGLTAEVIRMPGKKFIVSWKRKAGA